MRYIADSNGYLKEVIFGGQISCGGSAGVSYTGPVPDGYDSLAEWYQAEECYLYMWRVVDDVLVKDSTAAGTAGDANGGVRYFDGVSLKNLYVQGGATGGVRIPSALDSKRYWWLFNYIVNGTDYNKLAIRSVNTNGYYVDYNLPGKDDGDSTNTAYNILTAKDLEYGTWTPRFLYGTFTYTTQSGSYFKIGKMVYIQCELRTSKANPGSNGLIVGGIPYTPAKYAFMSGILDTVTGSINYRIALRAEPNNSFIRCLVGVSGTTDLHTVTTQYPTGTASVQFSGWYQIS